MIKLLSCFQLLDKTHIQQIAISSICLVIVIEISIKTGRCVVHRKLFTMCAEGGGHRAGAGVPELIFGLVSV